MKYLLITCVIIFLAGIVYRISQWFLHGLQPSGSPIAVTQRLGTAFGAIFSTLFSKKSLKLLFAVFADILFQLRSFNKSYLRWLAHFLIFSGFISLLLFHAMGYIVSEALFGDYYPTVNPYLFLRNLFGLMVLVGIGLAVFRRISWRPLRLKNSPGDWLTLIIISLIMLSGFMLEGTKIGSHTVYQDMVDEYGDVDDEEALALEAYWVVVNGLHSSNISKPVDEELLVLGEELHENSCIECHASNRNAFISFSASKIMVPLSQGGTAVVKGLTYLHILSCLLLLVWLPFSKMFHVVSAPVSLIIRRVMDLKTASPANRLTRQMVGLSACTHCGACSVECSAVMYFESFENDFILPSEKVQFLNKIAKGKTVAPDILEKLQKGLYICTSCDRCSSVCPSGINLREIFVGSRYHLLEQGVPEPSLLSHFSFPLALAQNFKEDHLKALKKVELLFKERFPSLSEVSSPMSLTKSLRETNTTFKSCYSCQRCTNICPVVRSYDNPGEVLGMLPHQIIFSLGIGNSELPMGAQMIWSCSTCYLCQEHCPNQVELCDIFYNIKNRAINTIEAGD